MEFGCNFELPKQSLSNVNQSIEFELNCSTNLPNRTLNEWPFEDKNLMALFLSIIPVMTVFGNLLVVISVYKEKTLRTATNYLIISLATSDLVVALCVMPFAVYVEVHDGVWQLPKSLCTCYTAIDVMASTASILNLVAISWDRYMAVSKPIEYAQSRNRKNRRVLIMITFVWTTSIVIAFPMITGLNRLDDTQYCEYTNGIYVITSSFASFFLPCLIMVALYGVVLRKLRQRREQRNRNLHHPKYKRSRTKKTDGYYNANVSNNDTISYNEISMVTGVSLCRETENNRLRVSSGHFRRRHQKHDEDGPLLESTFHLTQSPITMTSSLPVSTSMLNRSYKNINSLPKQCTLKNHLEDDKIIQDWVLSNNIKMDQDWVQANNNNTIMNIATVGLLDQTPIFTGQQQLTVTAFDLLEIDGESVPFIDASSVQGTPLRRPKMTNCNGTLKPFRSDSVDTLTKLDENFIIVNEDAAKISTTATSKHVVDNEPKYRRSLTTSLDMRRHSVGSLDNSTAAMQFRDRGCFSETAGDMYKKGMNGTTNTSARYSRQSRKERRATLTLAVVLVVFLCCWLPFFTCHVTNSICKLQSNDTCINIAAFFFTTWLGYMNSFMNPMIYTIFNPEYRRAFENILCFWNRRRR